MKIRPATLDDWNTVANFIEAMNHERTLSGGVNFTRMHLEVVHAAIVGDAGGVFIAYDGERPVGFTAMVSFPVMPPGYVEGVGTYVIHRYRRTKVAHELGVACREFHRERGGRAIYGTVDVGNEASVARCMAEGAEVVGLVLRYSIDAHPAEGVAA